MVGPRVSGYVNAVLRRVATRDLDAWLAIVAPDPATDPDGNLAVRYSYPRWIVAAYRAALGAAGRATRPPTPSSRPPWPEGNARPRVTMATLPGGPDREQVMPADAEPGRWSPYAFTLESGNPAALIASGPAAVQDEASQLAAIALTRAPRRPAGRASAGDAERWLDLCAGPGGKSRLLLRPGQRRRPAREPDRRRAPPAPRRPGQGAAGPGRRRDRHRPRRRRLEVVVADGTRPPWPDGTFDRVLVDAPCSGLGALRRRPEARWRKAEADLAELTALQRDAAPLGPGGRPPRRRGRVRDLLPGPGGNQRRGRPTWPRPTPDVEILDAPAVLPDVPGAGAADPLFAQLWPHRHGTDAIFIALLRRRRGPGRATRAMEAGNTHP